MSPVHILLFIKIETVRFRPVVSSCHDAAEYPELLGRGRRVCVSVSRFSYRCSSGKSLTETRFTLIEEKSSSTSAAIKTLPPLKMESSSPHHRPSSHVVDSKQVCVCACCCGVHSFFFSSLIRNLVKTALECIQKETAAASGQRERVS